MSRGYDWGRELLILELILILTVRGCSSPNEFQMTQFPKRLFFVQTLDSFEL
jgi:hypothetical protein